MNIFAQIWVLQRLGIYHAWTVLTMEHYAQYMRMLKTEDPTRAGFEHYYFIFPTPLVPLKQVGWSEEGKLIDAELARRAVRPRSLRNRRGDEVFRIYKLEGS